MRLLLKTIALIAAATLTACAANLLQPQASDLAQRLSLSGAKVTDEPHDIKITLPSNESFAPLSASLNHHAYPVLKTILATLKDNPHLAIKIIGYTDNQGSYRGNIIESEKRARAIAVYFTHRHILPRRVHTEGRGPADPIASNATPQGRALNRRVDIYLYRLPGENA